MVFSGMGPVALPRVQVECLAAAPALAPITSARQFMGTPRAIAGNSASRKAVASAALPLKLQ